MDSEYLELRQFVQNMVGKIRELNGEIQAIQAILLKREIVTQAELLEIRQRARNLVFDANLGMNEAVSGKDPAALIVMPLPDKQ